MRNALTAAYQSHLKATRGVVSAAVGHEWRKLGSYDRADIPRYLDRVVPIVQAGQARAVALTSAYLARTIGQPIVGLPVADLSGAAVRNGTPPDTVYTRAFIGVWADLKNGVAWDDAVAAGDSRVQSSAEMDVALSSRAATLAFGARDGSQIVGWRRVADSSCCDYCQAIDGAHTGPTEPQPLHNRCGCTAEPITKTSSLHSAEPFLLAGVVIGDVAIHQHGELGPVIGQKGDNFTSEADLADSGE